MARPTSWAGTSAAPESRSASTTYHYRVMAYNGSGSSPASNVASATTPRTDPF